MKSGNKMKGPAIPPNYTYKTTYDFICLWRVQDALKKKAAEEQIKQAKRTFLLGLMVWADDGGAAG
jgi:hypothetical protein